MPKLFKFFSNNNAYLLLLFYCSIAGLLIRFEDDYSLKSLLSRGTELRATLSKGLNDVSLYVNLKKENEKLTLQNSALLADVIVKGNALRDTASINRAAYFMDDTPVHLVPARVVERRFDTSENVLIINVGNKQGIEKDMAVLTPDGLVGRVVQVSRNYAKVMPVIHSEFSVSVVSDSSKTHGILRWNGEQEQIAQIHYVPLSSSMYNGEKIYTADFSTFALQGIPVGKVIEVVPEKQFYRIDIELGVNFSTLTHVMVAEKTVDSEKVELMRDATDTGKNSSQADRTNP
ncbi:MULTISPECIES: rod shape-determining protein MreC [unclassified Prosthecochloris]|uniref:rod shape-determining protein MreC n=1 Tax=unclassified Prosthecochloris TaxID=2632826 RepID=UPI00223E3DDD|nr:MULTISPECIES: rod shape-determining protein MreC [unclassified Prosthecochloris]UZJ38260.1 rod shape-determining protein MreC [Prosthecochloris sp. SCSIO W1103]